MRALATREPVMGTVMGVFHPGENRHRWILVDAVPEFRPGEDQPWQVHTTFSDITERKLAEEQRQESEERFRVLLNQSVDGIFVHQEFRIVQLNDRLAKMAGYAPSELLNSRAIDLFTPDSQARIRDYIRSAADGYYELELRHRTGGIVQVESFGAACKFQGRDARIVALRDVTERKRVELALRESEELFRSLSTSSPVGVFLADLQGRCVYANPRWRAILGLTLKESVGDGWFRVVHPDDGPQLTAQWSECVRQKGEYSGEFRIRQPTGKERWVHMRTAIRRADSGEPTGLVGTIEDITERKRTENALRDNEFVLKKSQTVARMGSYELDVPTGKWTSSPSLNEIFGIGPDYPKSVESWSALLPPADQEEMLRYLRDHVLMQHHRFEKEYRIIRVSDGQERWVCGLGDLEFDAHGNAIRMIGTIQDITERKRAEEALRRSGEQLRALAERLQAVREEERMLLAREVHDQVGQALTSLNLDVAWLGERLAQPGFGAAHRLLVGRLEAMSTLLAQTVSTVQRISSDLRPGILDDLGLSAAIEWQAEEFATRSGLICEVCCGPVSHDPNPQRATALFRILQELLTNVVRHAQASRVDVELHEDAGALILEVRDNGRGVTEEQTHAPKSLGLLGIRERAFAVGGQVEIAGQLGQGTRVVVSVPLL